MVLSIIQSVIGTIGALSFIISVSFFSRRNERKQLILFGLGSVILITLGWL